MVHRRKHGEDFYCLPGGEIETGESPQQAAIRDTREEAGIMVTIERKLLEYTDKEYREHGFVFAATGFSGEPRIGDLPKDADDSSVLEWYSLYELRYARLLPDVVKEAVIKEYAINFRWDKLVRDRLPEMIEARGRTSVWHVADDAEYWRELKKKLLEEVQEFIKTEGIKEIADIEEVMRAINDYKKFSAKDIETIRLERFQERGGYKKRIFLETSTGN